MAQFGGHDLFHSRRPPPGEPEVDKKLTAVLIIIDFKID
jgi:hypothetical protein